MYDNRVTRAYYQAFVESIESIPSSFFFLPATLVSDIRLRQSLTDRSTRSFFFVLSALVFLV